MRQLAPSLKMYTVHFFYARSGFKFYFAQLAMLVSGFSMFKQKT